MRIDALKKLEETMHVHVLISFQNFFIKFWLPKSGAA